MGQRSRLVLSILGVAGIALTTLTACGAFDDNGAALFDVEDARLLPGPGSYQTDPVWIPKLKKIVAVRGPRETLIGTTLYAIDIETGKATRLGVRGDPTCYQGYELAPQALPDGRLGYVAVCGGAREPESATTLRAFDVQTRHDERLVPYVVPYRTRSFGYGENMKFGLLNDGRGLYERIHRITPRKLMPIELPFARAGRPSFSPDGRMVAVDAVPSDGPTAEGPSRLDLPRKLYLMTPQGTNLRVLLEDLSYVGPSTWTPDGRSLVLVMKPDGNAQGLWQVNAKSGRKRLLLRSDTIGSAAVLPNGRTLVVSTVARTPTDADEAQTNESLYVLELPANDSWE